MNKLSTESYEELVRSFGTTFRLLSISIELVESQHNHNEILDPLFDQIERSLIRLKGEDRLDKFKHIMKLNIDACQHKVSLIKGEVLYKNTLDKLDRLDQLIDG